MLAGAFTLVGRLSQANEAEELASNIYIITNNDLAVIGREL